MFHIYDNIDHSGNYIIGAKCVLQLNYSLSIEKQLIYLNKLNDLKSYI